MDSSEDEDRARFEECLYPVSLAKNTGIPITEVPLNSNRVLPEENMQFDYRSVRVPERLQRHVIEHLDKLLSSETKFVKMSPLKEKEKPKKRKKKRDFGIVKLLRSCEHAVDLDAIPLEPVQRTKLPMASGISESERLRRAAQVAVSPEYILSKKEVEGWAPENKGVVEIISQSNKPKR